MSVDRLVDKNSLKDTIARNLKYYMSINGKDRADISKALGVSYTAVCSWCSGEKAPRTDKIERLCEYFRCSRSDLIIDKDRKDFSEIDALLARISSDENEIDLKFLREYVELSDAKKVLLTDIVRNLKKD